MWLISRCKISPASTDSCTHVEKNELLSWMGGEICDFFFKNRINHLKQPTGTMWQTTRGAWCNCGVLFCQELLRSKICDALSSEVQKLTDQKKKKTLVDNNQPHFPSYLIISLSKECFPLRALGGAVEKSLDGHVSLGYEGIAAVGWTRGLKRTPLKQH